MIFYIDLVYYLEHSCIPTSVVEFSRCSGDPSYAFGYFLLFGQIVDFLAHSLFSFSILFYRLFSTFMYIIWKTIHSFPINGLKLSLRANIAFCSPASQDLVSFSHINSPVLQLCKLNYIIQNGNDWSLTDLYKMD